MTAQMQEKMNQQQQQEPNFNTAAKATFKPTGKSDDYIEFEEVK
jgi:hypothetical protein